MFRLIALFLLCFLFPMASAQSNFEYSTLDLFELKKKVNQGDVLAMYWVAKKSKVFEEKAMWYEKYAKAYKTSASTRYLAELYDDDENPDYKNSKYGYFWYYITQKLCTKEEYEDKWCADAKQRLPELKQEISADVLSGLQKRAKKWLRKK